MVNKKIGVVIGRFQTPYLHEGHKHLIDSAIEQTDELIIVLGDTVDGIVDDRNPYSYDDRVRLIFEDYPDVHIVVLEDIPNSDKLWSCDLDSKINEVILTMCDLSDDISLSEFKRYFGEIVNNVTLYHSRDSFKEYYCGVFDTYEIDEIKGVSATQIRENLK